MESHFGLFWMLSLVTSNCIYAAPGALVGIRVLEGKLDVIFMNPSTLTTSVRFENITTVSDHGMTPKFSTAFCSDTENFLIAINDMGAPRIVGLNLRNGKVLGTIKVNGVYVDNLECDTITGFGMAYVFQLGRKHNVVKLDFITETHQVLMASSYKSYGGSAIDPKTARLFTVAVTPHFDAFNYSLSTLAYRNKTEILSPPFKHYSIGDLVYDTVYQQPIAIVQTPPSLRRGPVYNSFLAVLDICRGTIKQLAGPWPAQQPISESGVTLDPVSRTAYVLTEKYIHAVNIDSGKVLFSETTAQIPWPVLYYQFVR